MSAPALYIGIDVSKARLDVACRPGESFPAGNDPAGIRDLVERLRRLPVALVVLEATGGLELPAVAALAAAGLPAALVNPRGEVRAKLYMAALVAPRRNAVLRAFYERLRQAGKRAKVALTAVARNLLTIVNAVVRSGQPWNPELAAAH
jgi:transposase